MIDNLRKTSIAVDVRHHHLSSVIGPGFSRIDHQVKLRKLRNRY